MMVKNVVKNWQNPNSQERQIYEDATCNALGYAFRVYFCITTVLLLSSLFAT